MNIDDPIATVEQWFEEEAEKSAQPFIKMGTLATVSSEGKPSVRMVEIPFINAKGLSFFTHSNSQKAQDLSDNHHAALHIWLPATRRQISINGEVTLLLASEAERSWQRLPRSMQLSFMASNHAGPMTTPNLLERRLQELDKKTGSCVAMPDEFLGYCLAPNTIAFYILKHPDFAEKVVASQVGDQWNIEYMQP